MVDILLKCLENNLMVQGEQDQHKLSWDLGDQTISLTMVEPV
jgi:hypothetical protein